jgi:hypothetical protein
LKPKRAQDAFEVWCDMVTKTKDGKSGWTLCGKYDRDRGGVKFLAQGFGRSSSGASSMTSLTDFTAAADGTRWVSIDCRMLVQDSSAGSEDGATYMLHAASNTGETYDVYQFTNVLADSRKDASLFFDMASRDKGVCTSQEIGKPMSGGIMTWDKDWQVYTDNWNVGRGSAIDTGACLTGDGHHFCSKERLGARLNNAGGSGAPQENKTNCQASGSDTIYWSWTETDTRDETFGCGGMSRTDSAQILPVIGTGCRNWNKANKVPKGTKMPPYRYNMLFLY